MGRGSMPNSSLPNSYLGRKLPIAPWLYWRGEGLSEGEFYRPILWFSASRLGLKLPSFHFLTQLKYGDGALHHLPMWCLKVVLSEVDYAVNDHYIRFLRIRHPFYPSVLWQWVLLAMDGPGECPLLQQYADFPPATRLHPQASSPMMQTHYALPCYGW